MRKVAIIHFSPLEFYPPIQNLLLAIGNRGDTEVCVYTTKKNVSTLSTFAVSDSNIKIKRFGISGNNLSLIPRWLGYCSFYVRTFLHLLSTKPIKCLYYETLSFLPVYLYRKFGDRKIGIWAHYHEYTSPIEYETSMKLSRKFHKFERKLYASMDGVSHTNETRLNMFLDDIAPAKPQKQVAIPNYPPRSWVNVSQRRLGQPIRVVYVGALSLDTMHTREFAAWVRAQHGKVIWDIYTFNASNAAKNYLEKLNDPNINLNQGVDYDRLADVLSQYDVGVILYTGHIANYVYNAPNKLFEYLRMGLQVWMPDTLIGAKQYVESNLHPKVLSLNFKDLTLNVDDLEIKKGIPQGVFVAELANAPLLEYLMN